MKHKHFVQAISVILALVCILSMPLDVYAGAKNGSYSTMVGSADVPQGYFRGPGDPNYGLAWSSDSTRAIFTFETILATWDWAMHGKISPFFYGVYGAVHNKYNHVGFNSVAAAKQAALSNWDDFTNTMAVWFMMYDSHLPTMSSAPPNYTDDTDFNTIENYVAYKTEHPDTYFPGYHRDSSGHAMIAEQEPIPEYYSHSHDDRFISDAGFQIIVSGINEDHMMWTSFGYYGRSILTELPYYILRNAGNYTSQTIRDAVITILKNQLIGNTSGGDQPLRYEHSDDFVDNSNGDQYYSPYSDNYYSAPGQKTPIQQGTYGYNWPGFIITSTVGMSPGPSSFATIDNCIPLNELFKLNRMDLGSYGRWLGETVPMTGAHYMPKKGRFKQGHGGANEAEYLRYSPALNQMFGLGSLGAGRYWWVIHDGHEKPMDRALGEAGLLPMNGYEGVGVNNIHTWGIGVVFPTRMPEASIPEVTFSTSGTPGLIDPPVQDDTCYQGDHISDGVITVKPSSDSKEWKDFVDDMIDNVSNKNIENAKVELTISEEGSKEQAYCSGAKVTNVVNTSTFNGTSNGVGSQKASITYTMTLNDMKSFFDNPASPQFKYDAIVDKNAPAKTIVSIRDRFSCKITFDDEIAKYLRENGVELEGNSFYAKGSNISGFTDQDNGYENNNNWASNIIAWKTPSIRIEHLFQPWEWRTAEESKVYAEIVGNIVGASGSELLQDWNVSQGIPTTENVSVAIGGEQFKISMDGWIGSFGSPDLTACSNVGQGTRFHITDSMPIPHRTIEFDVTIKELWQNVDTNASPNQGNVPCTLSCPGHTVFHRDYTGADTNNNTSATGKGSVSTVTVPGIPGYTCGICGGNFPGKDPFNITATGYNVIEGSGENAHEVPATATASGTNTNHKCTWTTIFHCDQQQGVGQTSLSYSSSEPSGSMSKGGESMHKGSYGQRGCFVSGQYTCNAITYGQDSTVLDGDTTNIDYGYTMQHSYGCVCSNTWNCVHRRDSQVYKFYIQEAADFYGAREITSTKAYALTHARITKQDNSLFTNAVGRTTAMKDSEAKIWRVNAADINDPHKYAGRFYWTQWKDPTASSGITGPGRVAVVHTPTEYWLGNDTVTIYAVADHDVANDRSFALKPCNVKRYSGRDRSAWSGQVSGETKPEYRSANLPGDYLNIEQQQTEARHLVNAFLYANRGQYTLNIVSDAMSIGTGGKYQNVVADTYGLPSIDLCNQAFLPSFDTIYRVVKANKTQPDITEAFLHKTNWSRYVDIGTLDKGECYIDGYNGTITDNAYLKYVDIRLIHNPLIKSLVQGGSMLGKYTENNEIWRCGGGSPAGSPAYNKNSGSEDHRQKVASAQTYTVTVTSDSTPTNSMFDGYYSKFKYKTGNYDVIFRAPGKPARTLASGLRDCGKLASWNTADGVAPSVTSAYVISNLSLVRTAANGAYQSPLEITGYYTSMIDFKDGSTFKGIEGQNPGLMKDFKQSNLKVIANFADGCNSTNAVVIHDPVSQQYSTIVSNNFGPYAEKINDMTGQDQRIDHKEIAEDAKPKYLVVNNEFNIWVSNIGDFGDYRGSNVPSYSGSTKRGIDDSLYGSDWHTGKINRDAKGFTDHMNTDLWTARQSVRFTFPVSYISRSGQMRSAQAGELIPLNNVKPNRSSEIAPFDTLQNFYSDDDEFTYGMDYTFKLLTSARESHDATMEFYSYAINDNRQNVQPDETNKVRGSNCDAYHCADKIDSVEIVGRIGNITQTDSSDLRYSNLFKQAEDSWEIPGVVYTVDYTKPRAVAMTSRDILWNSLGHNKINQSHASLTITSFLINGVGGYGKAGDWVQLPIVPSQNNVKEYDTEFIRLGYKNYYDIETIGNYYGIEDEAPESPTDTSEDERVRIMTITPTYYLFDMSTGKYYAIDIYAGSTGDYHKIYGGRDKTDVERFEQAGLYIDLTDGKPVDMNKLTQTENRRDCTLLEKQMTAKIASRFGEENLGAFRDSDYIGLPTKIVLDQNDLNFIGSNYEYYSNCDKVIKSSDVKAYNQIDHDIYRNIASDYNISDYEIRDGDFAVQSQRWYFCLQLPSSSRVTAAKAVGSKSLSQADIITASERFKSQHPNSTIVTYVDINVVGSVWTLEYDYNQVNGRPTTTVFGKDKPDKWTYGSTNEITNGVDKVVYDSTGTTPVGTISKKWTPLLYNSIEDTSKADLTTVGTH